MAETIKPRVVRKIEYQDEDDRPRYDIHWRTVGLERDICGRCQSSKFLWETNRVMGEKLFRIEVARMIECKLREVDALPVGDTVVVEEVEDVEETLYEEEEA